MDAAGSTLLQVILIEAVNHAKGVFTEVAADLTTVGNAAQKSDDRMTAFAATMAKGALAVSALSGAIIAESVKAASGFNDQMQRIAGNTGLGTQAMEQMRGEVLKLGAEGPAPIDDIANGFMRAANMGYLGADAFKLVNVAFKGAVATGGSVEAMVNTLGTEMRNFHEPIAAAARDMGILMTAAAQGNVTLPDLTNNFSKVSIIASSIHMSIADAASVYSELTRATHDAALAQVFWVGMIQHMLAPTKQAQTILADLSKGSVNLTEDFKKFSLGQESFTSVMEKARVALHGNVQETFTLFGGLRGGLGALKLLGSGWDDYIRIQDQVKNHTIDVNQSFLAMQGQVGSVLKTLGNNVHVLAITIGEELLPPIESLAHAIIPVVQAFQRWSDAHKQLVGIVLETAFGVGALVIGLKVLLVTGGFIAGTFKEVAVALGIMEAEEKAATAATLALAAAEGAAAGAAAAMAAPEAAAGMAGLGNGLAQAGLAAERMMSFKVGPMIGEIGAAAATTTPEVVAAGAGFLGLSAGAAVATGGISLLATGLAVAYVKNQTFHDSVNSLISDAFGQLPGAIAQSVTGFQNLGDAVAATAFNFNKSNDEFSLWAAHQLQGNIVTKTGGDLLGRFGSKAHEAADGLHSLTGGGSNQVNALSKQIEALINPMDSVHGRIQAQSQAWREYQAAVEGARQALVKEQNAGDNTQSTDFQKVSKQASNDLQVETYALANAVSIGSSKVGQFTQTAAALSSGVQGTADALADAKDRIARANADWVTVNKDTSAKLKAAVDKSTADLVHGLETPGSNLKELAAAAAQATNAQVSNTDLSTKAQKLIAAAGGETATQLKAAAKAALDFSSSLTSKASKTVDDLAKAIDLGKGNIGALTASAKSAESAVGKYADSHIKAALKMGDFGLALDLTRTKLNSVLSNAQGKQFFDKQPGSGASSETLAADKEAVKRATQNVNDFAAATVKAKTATVDQAVAAGDYAKALTISRQNLQTALDSAEGKLMVDRANPNASPSLLAADQAAVVTASGKLDDFNKILTDTTAKGKLLGNTFADMTSKAQKTSDALDQKLAKAIVENGGQLSASMQPLIQDAFNAAKHLRDLADASAQVAKMTAAPQTADEIFKGWGSHLQTKANEAIDQLANDKYNKTGNLGVDEAAVKRSTKALDDFTAASTWAANQAKSISITAQVDQETKHRQDELARAEAQRNLDVLKGHTDRLGADNAAIEKAGQALDWWTGVIKKSGAQAAPTPVPTSGDAFATPGGPKNQFANPNDTSVIVKTDTGVQSVIDQLVTAGMAQIASQKDQTAANLIVAKNTGDVSTQYSILSKEYLDGSIFLRDFIDIAKQNAADLDNVRQRTIALDVVLGDFTGAATLAKQAMLEGKMSVSDYVDIQQKANKQADEQQKNLMQADIGLKDFSGAATIAKQLFADGAITFGEAVDVIKQSNDASKAAAVSDWNVSYAAADAAGKINMLAGYMQQYVSRQSQLQSMQSAVDNANIAVIAANSALEVAGINAATTAITNETSILSAQGKVQSAIAAGQLARINDQTTILQDQSAIWLATNTNITAASAGAIKVAQEQLAIDQVTARMHQVDATWQKTIALDELRAAQDKMRVDNANAAANAIVLMDHLKVAQIAVKIALDQQKLGTDMLTVLDAINYNLGGVEDFSKTINTDLATLAKDQADSTAASFKEAQDQASASVIAAQGAQTEALNSYQQQADANGQQADAEHFSLLLAGMNQQMELQKINNAQAAATAANTAAIAAQNASIDATLLKIKELENQGLDRFDVTRQSSQGQLDQLGGQRATNPTRG